MVYVGIDEAATRFKELIQSVEEGEEVMLTRDGQPVAQISQTKPRRTQEELQQTMREMLAARDRRQPVTSEEIRAWREEGRM